MLMGEYHHSIDEKNRLIIPSKFRNDILNEQEEVCAICGMKPEWNGKSLIFIVCRDIASFY